MLELDGTDGIAQFGDTTVRDSLAADREDTWFNQNGRIGFLAGTGPDAARAVVSHLADGEAAGLDVSDLSTGAAHLIAHGHSGLLGGKAAGAVSPTFTDVLHAAHANVLFDSGTGAAMFSGYSAGDAIANDACKSVPGALGLAHGQNLAFAGALAQPQTQSGLVINVSYGADVASAPSEFKTEVQAVVAFFESHFNDPVTINIEVDYGEVDGTPLDSGALGESVTEYVGSSFTKIKNALAADATTTDDATAMAHFASSDPTGGKYFISTAEAKAMGLYGANAALDGYCGFDSSPGTFDYNEADGITRGQYDFFATVAHEFSEVMGRILNVGESIGGGSSYLPYDLFHYSSNGVRDFSGTTAGYFSIDGGATNLDNFNTDPSGDFGDWAASAGNDAFDAFSPRGVVNSVTAADLTALDVIGWNAVVGNMTLTGTAGDDNLTGGSGDDTFSVDQGGNDTVSGEGGNDTFNFGATFTNADRVDGGDGTDTLQLDGNYASGVIFQAQTMVNVEEIVVAAGHSYKLVTSDATVAAGSTLTIDASALAPGQTLTFSGLAETDGSFVVNGGAGNDTLTGGAGDDVLNGNDGYDKFILTASGNDTANGGAGGDVFSLGATLTAQDRIDGGSGFDKVILNGDYSAGVVLNANTIANVELIQLLAGHDYKLTSNDATVAVGHGLRVDASLLGTGNALTFNGSAETDGRLFLTGGAGADHLIGGDGNDVLTGNGGADMLTGGSGQDHFIYAAVSDSTGANYDRILDFDASFDKFKLPVSVTGIDATISSGGLSKANFDANLASAADAAHLAASHAVVFTPDSGGLAGHTFLIVDANGTAGYQADQDLVFDITGAAHLANLTVHDFF